MSLSEKAQLKITEENRELVSREDINSLSHMLKIRSRFIKRQVETYEQHYDNKENPNAEHGVPFLLLKREIRKTRTLPI